jgi:hypothetical protein
MAYNGSGTFNITTAGQPVVTGTVISSTAFNALTADLATGLSTAITKDGQTTTTSRILFAQGISSTLVTDATSTTTGSIITAGGISCQKALFVGTTATLGIGTTPASITLNGQSGTGAAKGWAILPQVAGVAAGIIGSENYVFGSSDTNLVIQAPTSKSIKLFGGAGGSGLTISSTGALSAATADEVVGNFNSSHVYGSAIQFQNSGTTIGNIGGSAGYLGGAADDLAISVYGSHNLDFGNNGSLRARIDTSGNLLVGTTGSPSNARFRAYGNASAVFDFGPQTAAANTAFVVFDTGGAGAYLISGSGTWSSTSDIRLKNITGTYESPLEDIAKIQVIKYTWKNDDLNTPQVGVTAQSVQHVVPEAISECQVIPNDETKYLGVRYTELVPLLISSIQELTTRLAALENK